MSIEFWASLWVGLLWGSGAAFALVTLYILSGALLGLRARRKRDADG